MLTILEENIYYYKNAIKNPYSFIENIEQLDKLLIDNNGYITKWQDWTASGESDYVFGKQKLINIDASSSDFKKESFFIIDNIKNSIINLSNDYSKKHNNMNIGSLSPLSISKYFAGKYMGPHTDSYENDFNKTISVVLYLNNDYEGGELNFPNQNICIKPDAGSLVIFPSKEPYVHESKIILSGTKYMTPGFWELND